MTKIPATKKELGQVLAIAVVMLAVLGALVPAMVFYAMYENKATANQSASTDAFHLAEAGLEKGYLAISISTLTWVNLQNGISPTNYKYDKTYTDINGGAYTIYISSGPGLQQATIISIGRDSLKRRVRAIKAVYSNSPLGGVAIFAGTGVKVDNGFAVEWGSIVSPNNIDLGSGNAASNLYPQIWSAGSITSNNVLLQDTNPSPPNCDGPNCCQWHSYSSNIPPLPAIDFQFYKSSAQATTGCWPGGTPAGSCYYSGNQTFGGTSYTDTRGVTYYVDGNLTVTPPGIYLVGSLIVMGNVQTTSGNFGRSGSLNLPVPSDAWKQYCRNWGWYKTQFDPGAPASFPGLTSSYAPTGLTYARDKIGVSGLMYIRGNLSVSGGGGNSAVHGVAYVAGTSTTTSNSPVTLYYNTTASQNVQATKIVLSRVSWQDINNPYGSWPGP